MRGVSTGGGVLTAFIKAPTNSPILHANKNHARKRATTEGTNFQRLIMEAIPPTICLHSSKADLSCLAPSGSLRSSNLDAASRSYVFDFGLNTKLAGTVSFPEMVI